ncbi:hypothetical protein [Stetteria hydrogenophila]
MRRGRGLSEVLGSLILLAAITAAALAYAGLYTKAVKSLKEEASTAAGRVEDVIAAPLMMPDLSGGDLVLRVVPVKPVNVESVVLVVNGSVRVINVSKPIDSALTLTLVKGYRCEPVYIALVTGSGAVITYSPLQDPRAKAGNLNPDDLKYLEHGYVDCNVVDILKRGASSQSSTQAAQGATSRMTLYNGGVKYTVVPGDAPAYEVIREPNDVYTVAYYKVRITGSFYLAPGLADVSVEVYNADDQLLGRAVFTSPGERYLFTFHTDLGDDIPVYAKITCVSGACLAGLFFESNGSYIVSGLATPTLKLDYSDPRKYCPYTNLSFTLPLVLAPESSFTVNASGACIYDKLSRTTEFKVSATAWGEFATWGPLILIASTADAKNVVFETNIWLREAVKVNVSKPARASLPVSGAIEYSLLPVRLKADDPLTRAVLAYMRGNADMVELVITAGNETLRRSISGDPRIFPVQGANYSVEARLGAWIPFTTRLNISYTSTSHDGPYREETRHIWNVTTVKAFQLDPRSMPVLVKITDLEDGSNYIVALARSTLTVSQLGETYRGLAPIVGGIKAAINPVEPNGVLYIIKASGSLETAISIPVPSLVSDSQAYAVLDVDPSTGAFTPPTETGIYLIIEYVGDPSHSQDSPPATWIMIY